MAEYIEREKVLEAIQRRKSPTRSPAQNEMLRTIRVDVNRVPAADVVEVVRCKECKHSTRCGETRRCLHPFGLTVCDGNDFCSYGERRDG